MQATEELREIIETAISMTLSRDLEFTHLDSPDLPALQKKINIFIRANNLTTLEDLIDE